MPKFHSPGLPANPPGLHANGGLQAVHWPNDVILEGAISRLLMRQLSIEVLSDLTMGQARFLRLVSNSWWLPFSAAHGHNAAKICFHCRARQRQKTGGNFYNHP